MVHESLFVSCDSLREIPKIEVDTKSFAFSLNEHLDAEQRKILEELELFSPFCFTDSVKLANQRTRLNKIFNTFLIITRILFIVLLFAYLFAVQGVSSDTITIGIIFSLCLTFIL